MRKKKIYISIPITGRDYDKQRQHADLVARKLSCKGYQVVNPFMIYAGQNPTWEDYICADLRAMMDCDAVYFCEGWRDSHGCIIEHEVMLQLRHRRGLPNFIPYYEGEPWEE